MKTVFEHINHLKGKPHHIRKQIAFGAAAGTTAIIAVVWLAASLATDAFAIRGASFDERQTPSVTTDTHSGLAGAAAALPEVSDRVPAYIEIVDTSAALPKKQAEQTTLPF
jgi:hypothetical protein